MKSFCVLNSPLSAAAGESMGKAATAVLGRKIGVLSDGNSAAALHIANGIKKSGGCAVLFDNCFESQLVFAVRHYLLDGLFFVDEKNSLVTVYGSDARALSHYQEDELLKLTVENNMPDESGGEIINVILEYSYYKHLLDCAQSFENVCVNIRSSNHKISCLLNHALSALGGSAGSKVCFSLSESGFVLSAVDEKGKVYSHFQLMDVCTACEIRNGVFPTVNFFSAPCLDELAKARGFSLKRSFAGGDELWQRDAVFLAIRLMKYMSLYGCGLLALCENINSETVKRSSFSSKLSISDIADVIECEEMITDCNSGVFARAKQGNLLVTPYSRAGKYCIEVCAKNSETARELISSITSAACLT